MTDKASTTRDFVSHWRLDPAGRDDELAVATAKYQSVARVAQRRETARARHDPEEDAVEGILHDGDAIYSPGRRFSDAEQDYLRQQRHNRPQSASSARASTSQRSDSITISTHERIRPRSASASASASRRTSDQSSPQRKILQQKEFMEPKQRSKWTQMLHTSPGFQDQSLQRLEAETNALLRHVFQKRPATCGQRETKTKLTTKPKSQQKHKGASIEKLDDTSKASDTRKSLAVGSGLQVVRKRDSKTAAADPKERSDQQIQAPRKPTPRPGKATASRLRTIQPTASSQARESQTIREKTTKRLDPTRVSSTLRSTKTKTASATATRTNSTTAQPLTDKEMARRQADADARLKVMQEMGWLDGVVELQESTQETQRVVEKDPPSVNHGKKTKKKTKTKKKHQPVDTALVVTDRGLCGSEANRLCEDGDDTDGVIQGLVLEVPRDACQGQPAPVSLDHKSGWLEQSKPPGERDDFELESLLLQQSSASSVLSRATPDSTLDTVEDDGNTAVYSSTSSRVPSTIMVHDEFYRETLDCDGDDGRTEARIFTLQTIEAVLEGIGDPGPLLVETTTSHGRRPDKSVLGEHPTTLSPGLIREESQDCTVESIGHAESSGSLSPSTGGGIPSRDDQEIARDENHGTETTSTLLHRAAALDECDNHDHQSSTGEDAAKHLAMASRALSGIADVLADPPNVIEKEAVTSSSQEDHGQSILSSNPEFSHVTGEREDAAAEFIQRSWKLRRRCTQNEPLGVDRHDEHDLETESTCHDAPSIQEMISEATVVTTPLISDQCNHAEGDSHTTRKNDAARCIQQQYRRFVFRRDLLDQLSFFVRQHRRESRKKTRRLSAGHDAAAAVALIVPSGQCGVLIRVEDSIPQPTLGSDAVMAVGGPIVELDLSESVVDKATENGVVDATQRSVAERDKHADDETESCPPFTVSSLHLNVAVVDEDDTIQPLRSVEVGTPAAPWERHMDANSNKSFYFNRERRVSQWDRPRGDAVVDKTMELPDQELQRESDCEPLGETDNNEAAALQRTPLKATSLHEQWERYMDNETNRSFYFHPQRRLSQWERPSEEPVVDRVAQTEPQGHSISDTARGTVAAIAATELSMWWSRVKEQATLVESNGGWDKYLAKESAESFYYHADLNEYRLEADFGIPEEFASAKQERSVSTNSSAHAAEDDVKSSRWTLRRNCSLKSETRGDWQAFVDTESHQTFYYNARTGESTWVKPAAFQQAAAATEQQPRSYQWVMYVDATTSQSYYVNLETNATTWEKPVDFDQAASGQNLHRLRGILEQSGAGARIPDKDVDEDEEREGGEQDEYFISINDDRSADEWLAT